MPVIVPVIVHVCYGYALVYRDKRQSQIYLRGSVSSTSSRVPRRLTHRGAKPVVLGLLNHATSAIETPAHIAGRIREALDVVSPERLHPSSDCGVWYTPREIAFAKIEALVDGTELVRKKIGRRAASMRQAL